MRRGSEIPASVRRNGGFTLVEMIVAIVITGILVGIVGMFGRRQIDAYMDVGNRAELSDAADTALRRIARDLQTALPNSVRVDTSNKFIEYVPIRDAGRYQADFGGDPNDDPLDFGSSTDASFRVFGPPVTIRSGDQLVIFNLGQTGSDVYASIAAGSSRRAANAGTSLTKVNFTPGGTQFPLASPQSRFQIVGGPVSYECNLAQGTLVRHWCYDFRAAQPTVFGSLPAHAACTAEQSAILVSDVSGCSFNYSTAVSQRNGLVVLRLSLSRNGENVELLHQVDVLNTP